MSFIPSFKLYASNGSTPVYTFAYVINTNWPKDNPSSILLTNNRSVGSIVIPSGNKSWDLQIDGILLGTNYADLYGKKTSILSTIVANTRYVLKIDKTISTTDDFKVMRLSEIIWGDTNTTTYQYYTINFTTDTWV
jgi:hypothetical protein